MITRFSVPYLHECTIHLAKVASQKIQPQLVITNSKILSTYTDRILENKEIWISKGRIACIKENATAKKNFNDFNLHLERKKMLKLTLFLSFSLICAEIYVFSHFTKIATSSV